VIVYQSQRIEAGVAVRPARAATIASRPTAGGDVDLLAGLVVTCRDLALFKSPIELGPCAGIEVGRIHAAGFGVRTPSEASQLWVAPRVGGMITWAPLRLLGLVLRLEAAFPLDRPRFVLEEVGAVHRPSVAVGRAEAGVELRF
jgi:hypothetical protein